MDTQYFCMLKFLRSTQNTAHKYSCCRMIALPFKTIHFESKSATGLVLTFTFGKVRPCQKGNALTFAVAVNQFCSSCITRWEQSCLWRCKWVLTFPRVIASSSRHCHSRDWSQMACQRRSRLIATSCNESHSLSLLHALLSAWRCSHSFNTADTILECDSMSLCNTWK